MCKQLECTTQAFYILIPFKSLSTDFFHLTGSMILWTALISFRLSIMCTTAPLLSFWLPTCLILQWQTREREKWGDKSTARERKSLKVKGKWDGERVGDECCINTASIWRLHGYTSIKHYASFLRFLPKTKEMATSCFLGQHKKRMCCNYVGLSTTVIIQKICEILETDWGVASVSPPQPHQ